MAVDKELMKDFDKLFNKLDILCDSLEQKKLKKVRKIIC